MLLPNPLLKEKRKKRIAGTQVYPLRRWTGSCPDARKWGGSADLRADPSQNMMLSGFIFLLYSFSCAYEFYLLVLFIDSLLFFVFHALSSQLQITLGSFCFWCLLSPTFVKLLPVLFWWLFVASALIVFVQLFLRPIFPNASNQFILFDVTAVILPLSSCYHLQLVFHLYLYTSLYPAFLWTSITPEKTLSISTVPQCLHLGFHSTTHDICADMRV